MSVPSPIAPLGELAYHPQAQVDFEDGDGTFLAFHKKLRKKKRNYKPFPLRWPFLISLLLLLLLCIALIGSALILMPNSDSNAVISTPALSSISKRRHGNNQRDGALSARSPDDDSEDESSEDERVGGKKVQNSKNKSTMLAKKPKIKSGRVKWTTTAQPNRHGVQPPVTLTTTQGETTTVDTTEETTIYEPGKTGGPGPGNRPVKIEPGKSPEETDETVSTLPTESPRPTMNPDEPPAQTPQKTASGITTTVLSPAPPTTPPSEEDPGKGLETEPIEASEETLPTATRGPHDQTSLPIIESDELSTTETAYPIKETEDVSLTTTPVEATKSANREADPPEVEPSTTVETPELLPSTAIFENPGQDDSSATPTTSQPQPAKEPPKMETKTTFAGEQTTKNEGKTETKGVVVVPHSSSTTGAAELPDEHIINTMPTGDPVAIAQFETTVVSAAEPYLIITETGGVLVTDFITPSPTSYVLTYASEIEPTQMSMITDEGQWITVTTIVVVRVGGTVTQVLETRPPMTILTVVNNDLTEMVITPRPTPRQLTLGGTPMTFTSVYMSFKALAVDGDFTPTDIWPVQVTTTDVFVGSFLPVFAAAVISLVLRIIDMNAKMFQPFCALAKRQGAASAETVTLNFWEARKSWTMPLRMALRGHVVPVLTTGLVAGSWLLVPLAAEAINVKVYGSCQHGDEEGCGWGLGVARPFTYAMMAVIIVMAAVVALLARIIGRWKTGLSWNPWSIAGITLLAMNPQFRAPLVVLPKGAAHGAIKQATLENVYGGRRYKFGTYKNTDGDEHYGIVPANECATGLMEKMASAQAERNHRAQPTGKTTTRMHVPFVPLKFWWRAAVLLVHAALLALIVYYEIGSLPYSNLFERFMDRPDTKQRLVWSAVGVSLAFWWFYFCSSKFPTYIHGASPYLNHGNRLSC